jgi:di/tricarboxylate transporter
VTVVPRRPKITDSTITIPISRKKMIAGCGTMLPTRSTDIWIVFAIIAGVIALFMWDRFPVAVVCVASSLALLGTGVLDLNQSLAGFGDPAVMFIATLFVVSAGLERAGVTAWAGQALIRGAGGQPDPADRLDDGRGRRARRPDLASTGRSRRCCR